MGGLKAPVDANIRAVKDSEQTFKQFWTRQRD
jgi:hypothetical protein